jgi:hypothetical protein
MEEPDSSYATDTYIRMSAQGALLGQIPASLRAVSVDVDKANSKVLLRCIFDGAPTEDDWELLSVAATEIIADFSAPFTIEEEYLETKYPNEMKHLKHLVYLRHEKAGNTDQQATEPGAAPDALRSVRSSLRCGRG